MDDRPAVYYAVYSHLPQPDAARLARTLRHARADLVTALQAAPPIHGAPAIRALERYDEAMMATSQEVVYRAFSLGATGDIGATPEVAP